MPVDDFRHPVYRSTSGRCGSCTRAVPIEPPVMHKQPLLCPACDWLPVRPVGRRDGAEHGRSVTAHRLPPEGRVGDQGREAVLPPWRRQFPGFSAAARSWAGRAIHLPDESAGPRLLAPTEARCRFIDGDTGFSYSRPVGRAVIQPGVPQGSFDLNRAWPKLASAPNATSLDCFRSRRRCRTTYQPTPSPASRGIVRPAQVIRRQSTIR